MLAGSLSLIVILASCQARVERTNATVTPAISRSDTVPLTVQPFLEIGPAFVGNLACSDATVAWSTSSNTDPKHLNLDTIAISPRASPVQRVVARTAHGGKLGAGVSVSGDWVVFEEYQQAADTFNTNFWYIRAVNIRSQRSVEIASSREAPGRLELPTVSLKGDLVVWDELVSGGIKVIKLYHLASNATETLALPSGVYPVDPQIGDQEIVFLDNSQDPNHRQEDFLTRGGRLLLLTLPDRHLHALDSTADARQARLGRFFVAWHGTVPDPDHPNSPATVFDVRLSPLDGSKSRIVAQLGYRAVISDTDLVWYDDRLPGTFMYSLGSGRTRNLHVKDMESEAPTYALCGDTLFFVPLEGDGSHSIRSVKLPNP